VNLFVLFPQKNHLPLPFVETSKVQLYLNHRYLYLLERTRVIHYLRANYMKIASVKRAI